MSNWLSDPNNSNRFKQTYVLGFVDVSGNLIVRNGRLNVLGDSSFNGNIYANVSVTVNKNVYVLGDTSFNGNITCLKDASFSNGLYVGGNVNVKGTDFQLRDVVLHKTGVISGNTTLSVPLNQLYNITASGDISINLPKIASSRLEGSEITFYKSISATNTATLYSDASDGLVTYGTITSANTFGISGAKTSVKFVVAPNKWIEVGSSAIASLDGSFGNVQVSRNLRVFNDASFGGNLFVLLDASFEGNLTVIRDASFGGNVRIAGNLRVLNDASFGGNLVVLRDASFGGNLTVNRDASFGGNVRIAGNLNVLRDASFGGNLFVLRDASFGGNLTVIRDASFGGNVRIAGNLNVLRDASFGGNLFVLSDVSFGGNLTVIRDASFGGNVRIAGNLRVLHDASFGGNLFVLRDASFGGNLTVIRDASFGGNVNVANNIVLGNLIINNENLLRGNTSSLENVLTTKNTLGSDSIAASYDGRYVYYLDNNNTDGTNNTRSIFKSSNYGETFTLMYTYTNATTTYLLNKIATNQYGNVVAVSLNTTTGSGISGFLLLNDSSPNPVVTFENVNTTYSSKSIKMNSSGTYVHFAMYPSMANKGVYVYNINNNTSTNVIYLKTDGTNLPAPYNVQPLYYTTNNEVFVLPVKQHSTLPVNVNDVIKYVYLYNQNTPSQTILNTFGIDSTISNAIRSNEITNLGFKFPSGVYNQVGSNIHNSGCSANTPDNSVKIGFFVSDNSPDKILKVVANSDSNQITTSLAATCFTSTISPAITIRVICCGDTGQKLYIGTTSGLYYMYDPTPMTSDISNNTISLIPGTAGFNITSITCSKTTDYVYFSTNDNKMYRYTSENNVVMEFHPATNNVGIRNPNPRVELDVAGSVKVDNNLFVSSLTTTNNQVIHQNKFTLLGSTSLLNLNGLYPESIATSYDGRYVYYLDSAVLVRESTYTLNATDLFWYATNNPDFRINGVITDEQLQNHWKTLGYSESSGGKPRNYLEPFGGNCYTRVMKSVDYGKTFTEVYDLRSAFNTTNMTGNTITKIATNNSGSDIVFQRRLMTNSTTFNYTITYSTNYGSTFSGGFSSVTGVNSTGACLHYNNGGSVILSGYYGSSSSGIRKLNTISSTTLSSVLVSSSVTQFKMYGSKSLYYSGDAFCFLHNKDDDINNPTTLLNFVYYIPSTTTNISFTNIDVNGNLTSVSNVSAIKVSGNLSSYGFTVPSSKIQTNLAEPYMNGTKSTGCSANTPDGSVKIAFIISHSSPTKILKIAYDGKSMFDSCITIPGVTITSVCCGENGQHLYIATTRGMYYILDTSPMTSNIADQKVMLVSGTEYMNITAITCSKTSEYIFFSTAYGSTNNQLYRLFNNIMFEYVGQDSELLIKPYSGNVGIRNTNPQYELDVGGSVNISNTLYVNTMAITSVRATGTIYGLTDASFGGNLHVLNDSSLSNVRVSGNLRVINDASFGGNLFVLNDASFGGNLVVVKDGSINRNFRIGGDLTVNGSVTATAFNAMSDKRLKSNIQQLPSQWEKIKMLQPSEYTWRDSYVRDYGFVAQQVFEIYPHMRTKFHSPTMDNTTLDEPINIHGEPQYYSLDYSKMTTMLCKGLQEAMDIIEKQQVEIDGLKRKIDAIQDRLGPDV